jgi:hypothetical protein
LTVLSPQLHRVIKDRIVGEFAVKIVEPGATRGVGSLALLQAGNQSLKDFHALF